MRQPVLAALGLLIAQLFSTAAQADIEVSINPDQVRQCRPAHFFASVNNDSSEPMEVDLIASMAHGNRRVQTSMGHFVIAAGESYVEEFDFVMPPIALGNYTFTVRAEFADHSSIEGEGRFTLSGSAKPGTCPEGVEPTDLFSILAAQLPLEPVGTIIRPVQQFDSTSSANSTTAVTTWQTYKMLYR